MAISHAQKIATDGIAAISYATIGEIGVGTTWAEGFYTLKDSVSISQAEPTKSEIKVDQLDAPVYLSYDAGEFTVTGTIPDVSPTVMELLYNKVTAPYAPAGFTAVGVKTTTKVLNKMWKIDFASGASIIITNGNLIAALNGDNLSTGALGNNFVIVANAGSDAVAEGADVVVYNTI